jgi:hypothetical protein
MQQAKWKVSLASVAVLALAVGGLTAVNQPAAARPTVTVYKTPT